jgi:hypothetical protein
MCFKALKFFFLCFAFLLTQKTRAESSFFQKAQEFFSQSQKAVKSYLISGKGAEEIDPNIIEPDPKAEDKPTEVEERLIRDKSSLENHKPFDPSRSDSDQAPPTQQNEDQKEEIKPEENSSVRASLGASRFKIGSSKSKPKAIYLSLMTQSVNDQIPETPEYAVSLAVTIPVYSSYSLLSSEFQFAGDIKNAREWGQIQFLQKESVGLFRFAETQFDLFAGVGFGFSHGSEVLAQRKVFAPWALGLQWGKIYKPNQVFFRFELGWAGDFYFSDSNYSQGLLANISLGYKL